MTLYSVRSIVRLEFINWGWKQIFGSGWIGLHNVFKLICILTTLSLVVWCAYEFNKNEDICEVSFKGFLEDKESVYPDLIFGVQNRFNETVLRTYDETCMPPPSLVFTGCQLQLLQLSRVSGVITHQAVKLRSIATKRRVGWIARSDVCGTLWGR